MFRIRQFRLKDAPACHAVLRRAVLEGTSPHYTPAEQAAWAGGADAPADWARDLSRQWTFVGQGIGGIGGIAGFLTLGRDGHLDYFYVAPEQRRGTLAARLYCAGLNAAQTAKLSRLETQASHLARRFLEKRGWQVVARQSVIRNGVALTNFRMEKELDQV